MAELTTKLKNSALFIIALTCCAAVILGQSSDQNYLLTRTMLDESGSVYMDKFDYHDGLGRPVQSVLKKAAPGLKDIATLLEYDGTGRPSNTYIATPVTGATGAYVTPPALKTASNSFYGDSLAYGKTLYEASPLNRVTDQYGPGSTWHTGVKRVATGYHANSTTGELSCALYAVASASSLQCKGLYAAGELYVTKTTGEDGHVSYTFTDKLGQVVLERVMDGSVTYDTYYVYDDFGTLRYVIPPAAADALTGTATWTDDNQPLKDFAYVYKYDDRLRCIQKRFPGCDPVEMRYDKADRLSFSQDGNQKSKGEWTFYLYDAFGRPTVTGVWVSATVPDVTGTVVKTTYDATGSKLGGYTANLTLPPTVKLMMVNYYDDYAFTSGMSQLNYVPPPTGFDTRFTSAKGQLTGTRAYQLNAPAKYTVTALYYDYRGCVVQTHASNHLGGFEDTYFAYTFTGKVKQRQQMHSAPNATTQTENYTYDYGTPATNPAERLQSVHYKLNGNAQVTLAQYTYDDVGRVKTKTLGTETSTYAYNIRSWVTQITGAKFNQTLTYNAAVNGVTPTKALYGGNISAMKWKSGDESAERGYRFTYDRLDRLTAAAYGEGAALTANPGRFNESVTYNDKMGNIKTLQRQGKITASTYGLMDNLTYAYSGNKLTKVTDASATPVTNPDAFHFVDGANVADEYSYDANGNITKDLNKNITSITYNSLNLPSVITFGNGNTATYVYDGAGSKLSVAYKSGTVTTKMDYAGNKVYSNGTLSMILTEEGYLTLSGTTPTYYYYLKDHQGNNRVVINQGGAVQQVNHYYAFGGLFDEGAQTVKQRYRYNSKELDTELGLNMYDYGARHYDAALGRWFTVDPLAEKYYGISPYVYVANNPVNLIDPNGMWIDDYSINEKERLITIIKQDEKVDRVFDKNNSKGKVIEKGSFDIEKYRNEGYKIETLVPAGMSITDLGLSIFTGEMAAVKVGAWIGKGGEQAVQQKLLKLQRK